MTGHRFRAVVVAIATAAALSACSPTPPSIGTQASPSGAPVAPSASPSPSEAPAPVEPLTGLPGTQTGGAVVVPINVVKGAAAPVGLGDADIVSVEFSEQGGFHLVGMFQSKYPSKVGPLAEVRPSDMKIVAQENPVIAQSGAPAGFMDTAKTFALTIRSGSKSAAGFSSSGNTLYADPNTLRGAAKTEPSPIFEYATSGRALARLDVNTISKVVVSAPGHAAITWTLDDATDVWHTQIGGVVMTTTNLVIIPTAYETKHISALRRDLTFANPLTPSSIRGATVVAADSVISATWIKKSYNSALNLLGPDQDTPQLTAGTTWIMWTPPGSKVTTS